MDISCLPAFVRLFKQPYSRSELKLFTDILSEAGVYLVYYLISYEGYSEHSS